MKFEKASVYSPGAKHCDNAGQNSVYTGCLVVVDMGIYHVKHMAMLNIWRLFSLSIFMFNLVSTDWFCCLAPDLTIYKHYITKKFEKKVKLKRLTSPPPSNYIVDFLKLLACL